MIAPPDALVSMFKSWNDFYSHSKMAETVVTSLHVCGLVLGGGLAIAADRGTLRALKISANDRAHHTNELAAVHRWVLTGLTIVVLSGLAMFAADIETFWGSWIYWTKMALFVLLLVNGLVMTRAESALRQNPAESSPAWGTLRNTAISSLGLWFAITILGIAVVNFS